MTWTKYRNRVARIRCLYTSELLRVGLRLKIRTLGRLFTARKVSLDNRSTCVLYTEKNTSNWIKVTSHMVQINVNERLRTRY